MPTPATDEELAEIADRARVAAVAAGCKFVPLDQMPKDGRAQVLTIPLWQAKGGHITPELAAEKLAGEAWVLQLDTFAPIEAKPRRKDGITVVHVVGWKA